MSFHRPIKMLVAIFTSVTFLATSLGVSPGAFAAPAMPEVSLPYQATIDRDLRVAIPQELGKLEHFNPGAGNQPAIFHIQTAHGHYESQQQVRKILHYLDTQYGVKTVLVEGSAFQLDPKLLNFFPKDPKLTQKVNDELTKRALVKGPELYLLDKLGATSTLQRLDKERSDAQRATTETKSLNVERGTLNAPKAYGIEKLEPYRENGLAFVEVLDQKEKTSRFLADMDMQIERLTGRFLSTDLRDFLRRVEGFEKNKIPLDVWLRDLKEKAQKSLEIDLASPAQQLDWPMMVRFFKMQELAARLDLQKFPKEREVFMKAVKRFLPVSLYGEIERFLTSEQVSRQLPDPETGLLFEDMVKQLRENFNYDAFPNVRFFIGTLLLQSELKADRLLTETKALATAISGKLTRNQGEKRLVALLADHRLLQKLFALELMPEDYDAILARSAERGVESQRSLKPSVIVKSLLDYQAQQSLRAAKTAKQSVLRKEIATPHKTGLAMTAREFDVRMGSESLENVTPNFIQRVKTLQFSHIEELDALYEKAMKFYAGVKERDGAMEQRIEERLRETGAKKVAVITGGFHSGPFKEHFSSRDFSYALISPRLTLTDHAGHAAYESNMIRFSGNGERGTGEAPSTSVERGAWSVKDATREFEFLSDPKVLSGAYAINASAMRAEVQKIIQEVSGRAASEVKDRRSESRSRLRTESGEATVRAEARNLPLPKTVRDIFRWAKAGDREALDLLAQIARDYSGSIDRSMKSFFVMLTTSSYQDVRKLADKALEALRQPTHNARVPGDFLATVETIFGARSVRGFWSLTDRVKADPRQFVRDPVVYGLIRGLFASASTATDSDIRRAANDVLDLLRETVATNSAQPPPNARSETRTAGRSVLRGVVFVVLAAMLGLAACVHFPLQAPAPVYTPPPAIKLPTPKIVKPRDIHPPKFPAPRMGVPSMPSIPKIPSMPRRSESRSKLRTKSGEATVRAEIRSRLTGVDIALGGMAALGIWSLILTWNPLSQGPKQNDLEIDRPQAGKMLGVSEKAGDEQRYKAAEAAVEASQKGQPVTVVWSPDGAVVWRGPQPSSLESRTGTVQELKGRILLTTPDGQRFSMPLSSVWVIWFTGPSSDKANRSEVRRAIAGERGTGNAIARRFPSDVSRGEAARSEVREVGERLTNVSKALSGMAALIALAGFLGPIFDINVLTWFSPTLGAMKASTASSFILASVSLNLFLGSLLVKDEAKKQQEEAKRKTAEQEHLAALGELLAGVAHELNNPLATMEGVGELLGRALASGEIPEAGGYLHTLMESIRLSRRTIGDFLLSVRAEGSSEKKSVFPIAQALKAALEFNALVIRSNQVDVRLEVDDSLRVYGDEGRMTRVFMNLIKNAIDAPNGQGDKRISITAEGSKDQAGKKIIKIEVRDNGIGAESSAEWFRPFFSTKSPDSGTGLGLSIVKSLIEEIQGSIKATTALGKGTVIEIVVPQATQSEIEVSEQGTGSVAQATAGTEIRKIHKILVIDDEESIRMLYKMQLGDAGFEVVLAENGQEALDLLDSKAHQAQPFDLVITDYSMPMMNGAVFVRAFRVWERQKSSNKEKIPVVLMTSFGAGVQYDESLRLKAQGVFDRVESKDLRSELLRDLVAQMKRMPLATISESAFAEIAQAHEKNSGSGAAPAKEGASLPEKSEWALIDSKLQHDINNVLTAFSAIPIIKIPEAEKELKAADALAEKMKRPRKSVADIAKVKDIGSMNQAAPLLKTLISEYQEIFDLGEEIANLFRTVEDYPMTDEARGSVRNIHKAQERLRTLIKPFLEEARQRHAAWTALASVAEPSSLAATPDQAGSQVVRILFADDEDSICLIFPMLFDAVLTDSGSPWKVEIETVDSGEKALEAIKAKGNGYYDGVILDNNFKAKGKISGIEVGKKLKEEHAYKGLLILASGAKHEGSGKWFSVAIEKPFESEHLRKLILDPLVAQKERQLASAEQSRSEVRGAIAGERGTGNAIVSRSSRDVSRGEAARAEIRQTTGLGIWVREVVAHGAWFMGGPLLVILLKLGSHGARNILLEMTYSPSAWLKRRAANALSKNPSSLLPIIDEQDTEDKIFDAATSLILSGDVSGSAAIIYVLSALRFRDVRHLPRLSAVLPKVLARVPESDMDLWKHFVGMFLSSERKELVKSQSTAEADRIQARISLLWESAQQLSDRDLKISRSEVRTEDSFEIVPAEVSQTKEVLVLHNEKWAANKNKYMVFSEKVMRNLIEKGRVYLLQDKEGDQTVRGVLLTHPIQTGGDLEVIRKVLLWKNMIEGRTSEGAQDTVFFWGISVADSRAVPGVNAGQIFAKLAVQHFLKNFTYVRTFSPIVAKDYESFRKKLTREGLTSVTIRKYGIYLYLASAPVEGPWPYVDYIQRNSFVTPEVFFKSTGRKFRDPAQNFHVGRNGAKIIGVLPQKKGYTRPDGPFTAIYGYGPGESDENFRRLSGVPLPGSTYRVLSDGNGSRSRKKTMIQKYVKTVFRASAYGVGFIGLHGLRIWGGFGGERAQRMLLQWTYSPSAALRRLAADALSEDPAGLAELLKKQDLKDNIFDAAAAFILSWGVSERSDIQRIMDGMKSRDLTKVPRLASVFLNFWSRVPQSDVSYWQEVLRIRLQEEQEQLKRAGEAFWPAWRVQKKINILEGALAQLSERASAISPNRSEVRGAMAGERGTGNVIVSRSSHDVSRGGAALPAIKEVDMMAVERVTRWFRAGILPLRVVLSLSREKALALLARLGIHQETAVKLVDHLTSEDVRLLEEIGARSLAISRDRTDKALAGGVVFMDAEGLISFAKNDSSGFNDMLIRFAGERLSERSILTVGDAGTLGRIAQVLLNKNSGLALSKEQALKLLDQVIKVEPLRGSQAATINGLAEARHGSMVTILSSEEMLAGLHDGANFAFKDPLAKENVKLVLRTLFGRMRVLASQLDGASAVDRVKLLEEFNARQVGGLKKISGGFVFDNVLQLVQSFLAQEAAVGKSA